MLACITPEVFVGLLVELLDLDGLFLELALNRADLFQQVLQSGLQRLDLIGLLRGRHAQLDQLVVLT